VVAPATKPKGGQFVLLHAEALHGNPFDGLTLAPVIVELEALTGVETRRIHVDKGYRGHTHIQKFREWISGQVRRVSASIRREMRRRAASSRSSGTSRPSTGWVAITSNQRMRRRPHQCRARRCRLQLQPAPALARAAFARLDRDAARRPSTGQNA
jgi:hypothetical protein